MNSERQVVCRSCGEPGLRVFLDLGSTPLANALVEVDRLSEPEDRFRLEIALCENCALVQILEEVPAEKLFVENYPYFSSFSDALLVHSSEHANNLIESRHLGADSLVVEIASNDGYLLKNFVAAGVPVVGIDPAPEQASAAEKIGVPTVTDFFGVDMAQSMVAAGQKADVIIANNVLAHVPDLNGVVAGMAVLLADNGVITVENPYVRELIDRVEFDTIYHEHFCYFSCTSIDRLMIRHGLFLNHVEFFPDLHGGTLRYHIEKVENRSRVVLDYLAEEQALGLDTFPFYSSFSQQVEVVKSELVQLLGRLRDDGYVVAGYGAAAKGSTLLNSAGIGTDLVRYVVDRNTYKQGLKMPGTGQLVVDPEVLSRDSPDFVLLLAWNFAAEIIRQQAGYLEGGGKFIVPIPKPEVIDA